MAFILAMMLVKRVGDHHVSQRHQRAPVIAAIIVLVVVCVSVAAFNGADARLVALGAAALATVAILGVITKPLQWKISFHSAVAAGSTVALVLSLDDKILVIAIGAAATLIISIARVIVHAHTAYQVLAGGVVGVLTVACAFAVLV